MVIELLSSLRRREWLAAWVLAVLVIGAGPSASAAIAQPSAIAGDVPAIVHAPHASAEGSVAANRELSLNIALGARNEDALRRRILDASDPSSPDHGDYLSEAQYDADFAPTEAELAAVETWARSEGMVVTGASDDRELVHVRGSAATVDAAFDTAIDGYQLAGRSYYANTTAPSVPAGLNVEWVSGLTNAIVGQAAVTCAEGSCGYDGSDFRAAYDLSGEASGQLIGFTLWGHSLPQQDYSEYAKNTKTTPLTVGAAGPNGLQFVDVGGASSENESGEIALDTQNAHTVAPGAHETYWLGVNNSAGTLESVLDEAASSEAKIVSNSWLLNSCTPDLSMETSLEHGAATGKTFYFATGDAGAVTGCTYPSASQYVVAVGGTELEVGAGSTWEAEEAFNNNGGCGEHEERPPWQTGVGSPLTWPSTPCKGRATPDVSADSCFSEEGSGFGCWSYVYFEGESGEFGGTSLATPIWAAASAVWNSNNAASGRPGIGFVAPLIYSLANNSTAYARDFHDIVTGSNGFAAVPGWDEATGWGTPDFNQLAGNPAALSYSGATAAAQGTAVTLTANLHEAGTATGLGGRAVQFSVAGEGCAATTDAGGTASCAIVLSAAPGAYTVSAQFTGDVAYLATSTSATLSVSAPPAPPAPTPTPGGGGPTPTGGVTPAQIRAALANVLGVAARTAKLAAVRTHRAFKVTFVAPEAGKLNIVWRAAAGHGGALIGSGSATFSKAGSRVVTIALTAKGRKLLAHARRLEIRTTGSFTPTGGARVQASGRFALR